ncbi:MAG: DUF4423 domain-containing protein [Bdellovibrio sp.]|nr:DUF4423 domain-containing protein [Bdellovibrio sp.]
MSTLSEVLNGKYGLSKKRIAQVVAALQLSSEQAQHFADLVQKEHGRNVQDRGAAQERVISRVNFSEHSISLDSFKLVADWYHMALLELIALPDFKNEISFIAKRLVISEKNASDALERLERLGLLEKTDQGLRVTDDFSAVGDETPSQAIRRYHTQLLEKSIFALETVPVQEREMSSTVFKINKEDLPEAKKKLVKFRREFSVLLSKSENKNDVFCLGIQYFSLLGKDA